MNKLGFAFGICISFIAIACSSVTDLRTERIGNTQNTGTATTSATSTTTTTTTDTSSGGGGAGNAGGSGGAGGDVVCPPTVQKILIQLDPTTPFSSNVVAGTDAWTNFSTYTVTNISDEPQQILAAGVYQANVNGDAEDFDEVGIAMDGVLQLRGSQYITQDNGYQVFLIDAVTPEGITISPQATIHMNVWGKVAHVISSAAAGGLWHGVPRSGHSDALGIVRMHVTSDPSCTDQGAVANGNPPWPKIIRKSVPTITKQPLASNTLANVDMDLVKFQVAADAMGSIAWKQSCFRVTKSPGAISLSSFRIRRGAMEMPTGVYKVTTLDGQGHDAGGVIDTSTPDGGVCFSMVTEEYISGSGQVYTIHATVAGAALGTTLDIFLLSDNIVATGYVTKDPSGVQMLSTPNGTLPAWTIWSDAAEDPHSAAFQMEGGSSDWIPGTLVNDIGSVHEHFSP